MSSVNKVILVGNLGADPEVRSFQNGGKVCNLRIATSETWKEKTSGEKRERTEWHSVAIFNEGAVAFAERYLRKGAKVYVEGQIETRKWQDQSGNDRYSTEVVVRPYRGAVQGISNYGSDGGSPDTPAGQSSSAADYRSASRGSARSYQAPGDMDDDLNQDIPF